MPTLSDLKVKALLRRGHACMTSDGDGLYLRIRKSGRATWTMRYAFGGKDVWLLIGDAPDMPLKTAREEARARRVMVDQGRNPLAEKRAKEAAEARRGDFGRLALDWYEREIAPKYKHPRPVLATLNNHIIPKLGRQVATEITPADCERVIEPLRETAPAAANDVLRYLKRVFAYGKRRHIITTSPVADFDPTHDAGGKEVARDRVLTGEELVKLFEAMRKADSLGGDNALAIKLMLALCVRKSELLAARWEEFDLEGRGPKGAVWRLPAARTKTATGLDVPLPRQAVEWLRALRVMAAGSEYVFPKRRSDPRARQEHVGLDTLNVALKRISHGLPAFTLHDLRRTARTHLAAAGVRMEVAERCLNHKIKGVLGVYDRHDYYPERRQALADWALRLQSLERGVGSISMNRARKHRAGGRT